MHLVDTIGGEGYAVVFVEPEEGQETDPRLTDAKRKELERIAKCCSAQEVLEVSPGSSPALVKKPFLKKSLMVHPDKNAFGGATEAMKILSSAVHAIEKGDARWRPPRFVVGGAAKELPQISRFLQAKRSHFREDVVKIRQQRKADRSLKVRPTMTVATDCHKQSISGQLGSSREEVEAWLFHGTDDIDAVLRDGFKTV